MGAWLRQHWLGFAGATLAAEQSISGMWPLFRRLLEWVEHLKFISESPTMIHEIFGWLADPPPYLSPILVLVGVCLIYWDYRKWRGNTSRIPPGPITIIPPAPAPPVPVQQESQYISLLTYTRIMYGILEKSILIRTINEKANGDQDRMIELLGGLIVNYLDVYGVKPPGFLQAKIAKEEFSRLQLSCLGVFFVLIEKTITPGKKVVYNILQIKNQDMERVGMDLARIKDSPLLQI